MNRILLIEDDLELASSLKNYLTSEGFLVTVENKIRSAANLPMDFDLIVLDWMLPDGQGIDILRKIRGDSQMLPVIFLTAKAELVDKVLALESGANDYIAKPFEPRELLARIRVQLRKNISQLRALSGRGLIVDLASREVKFRNKLVETTRKEFDLLVILLTNRNKVFSREELLNKVWGFDNFPTTRTVDTHVLQIRQKTDDDLIQTVRGIGYCIRIDDELT